MYGLRGDTPPFYLPPLLRRGRVGSLALERLVLVREQPRLGEPAGARAELEDDVDLEEPGQVRQRVAAGIATIARHDKE